MRIKNIKSRKNAILFLLSLAIIFISLGVILNNTVFLSFADTKSQLTGKILARQANISTTKQETILTTADLPDENATSVTFQFRADATKINSSQIGQRIIFSALNIDKNGKKTFYVASGCNTPALNLPSCISDYGWIGSTLKTYFKPEYIHTFTFDFASGNYSVSVTDDNGKIISGNGNYIDSNSVPVEFPKQNVKREYTEPLTQKFGLLIYPHRPDMPSDISFTEVKCFDSTGKDLGLSLDGVKLNEEGKPELLKVAPENVKSICATFDMTTKEPFYLVSKDYPSTYAKEIIFQFEVEQFNQTLRSPWVRTGAVNGTLTSEKDEEFFLSNSLVNNDSVLTGDGLCDYGFYRWINYAFKKGFIHTYIFDLENNSYTITVMDKDYKLWSNGSVKNQATGKMYNYADPKPRDYDSPYLSHFGLKMMIETLKYDKFDGAFNVKCWDDTGKDLGITFKSTDNKASLSGESIKNDVIISSFGKEDALFADQYAYVLNGKKSFDYMSTAFSGNIHYISSSSDDIKDKGASDSVLKYNFADCGLTSGIMTGTFYSGNKITSEQLNDENICVKLRMFCDISQGINTDLYLVPATDSKVDISNTDKVIHLLSSDGTGIADSVRKESKFTDVVINKDKLSLLANENGDIDSFTVVSVADGKVRGNASVYFDKLFISGNSKVNFYDGQGKIIKTENVTYGNTPSECGIEFPSLSIDGKTVAGWTKTSGGKDLIFSDTLLTGDIDLYPFVGEEIKEYSKIQGVYANTENGFYAHLSADKEFVYNGISEGKYLALSGNEIVVEGYGIITLNGDILTIDGVEYKKVSDTLNVSFYIDDKPVNSVTVPLGFKVKRMDIPYKKFSSGNWMKGGQYYDFSLPVTEDLRLDAKYIPSFIDGSSFIKSYYNETDDILYRLMENGKAIMVKNKEISEIDYSIVVGNIILIDGKEYSINDFTISYFDERFEFLRDSYTLTLEGKNGSENREIIVSKDDNYLVTLPDNLTRDGYVFKGWKDAEGNTYSGKKIVCENETLFADWEYVQDENIKASKGCNSSISAESYMLSISVAVVGMVVLFIIRRKNNG